MRSALIGAGMDVESSNAEYGPGQIEINIAYDDAMTCADNTVLFKSIVKQVAVQHGLRATFMPKPWTEAVGQRACTCTPACGPTAPTPSPTATVRPIR